jgi:hypothetical protein
MCWYHIGSSRRISVKARATANDAIAQGESFRSQQAFGCSLAWPAHGGLSAIALAELIIALPQRRARCFRYAPQ